MGWFDLKRMYSYYNCKVSEVTLSPHTARKSSLQGLPLILSTVNGIGADASLWKHKETHLKSLPFLKQP